MSKAKQKKHLNCQIRSSIKEYRKMLKESLQEVQGRGREGVPVGWVFYEEAYQQVVGRGIFLNDAIGNLAPECMTYCGKQRYVDPDFIIAVTEAKARGFKLQSEEYEEFRKILDFVKGGYKYAKGPGRKSKHK